MSTTAFRRISTGVGWGAFAVLAWAAITLLTSTGTAHADDGSDGLLPVVGATVSNTTEVVTDTVDVVTDTVAPVITEPAPAPAPAQAPAPAPAPASAAPAAPAPAAPPVVPVVSTVVETVPVVREVAQTVVPPVADAATNAVDTVAAPVADLLGQAPVSQIADPVVDVVAGIPVVGQVLDDLAVTDAVTEVAGAVDAVAGLAGDAVTDAPPVRDVIDSVIPLPLVPIGSAVDADTTVPSAAARVEPAPPSSSAAPGSSAVAAAAALRAFLADRIFDDRLATESSSADAPTLPARAPHGPPASSFPPSSSAGHGGSPVGDSARLDGAASDALDASTRNLAATDDDLPVSAVADTDTSPD